MMTHMLSRIFGRPLLLDEGKAAAILAAAGGRLVHGTVCMDAQPSSHFAFQTGRPSLGVIGDTLGRRYDARGILPFDMYENIALIPIEGTLVYKGGYIGAPSGITSYQGLQAQIRRAAASPEVKGVVFEVDSYGGESAGAFETALEIYGLSKIKPTIAILTDSALSAGYLLAAAAREIVMPEFGAAGSIGVIMLHADYSRQIANDGIQVTVVASGRHKADGSPLAPLPGDLLDAMQSTADAMRRKFASHVSRFRAGRLTYQAAMETEAKIYEGPKA
ncbi:MAG TPA: S49 family peptidase, partial [Methylocella sp.]|nr:S49 family peptidase [Methylocella sp.]